MKVHSHALEAYSRTALSSVSGARPAPKSSETEARPAVEQEAAYVSVSKEARELASQSAGYDEKKVAALKAQVDGGQYHVNPQILAMRLLDTLG